MEERESRTPYDTYEAILNVLNAKRLELVRKDQELIRDGWQIHFAIDPYDIGEFCFPFTPKRPLSQFEQHKVEEISRIQNGRYEAIYKLSNKPILLESYVEEMDTIQKWAKWSNLVPTETDLLDNYLAMLRIPSEIRSKQTKVALAELGKTDISSLIAVATGIVSIGNQRLNEILTTRLVRGLVDGSEVTTELPQDDSLVEQIYRYFEGFRTRREALQSKKHVTSKWVQRTKYVIDLNNWRDAKAIAEVVSLNQQYNEQKHLILYLSSSRKSRQLFQKYEMNPFVPSIHGVPYNLSRTPKDLFAFMLYRGDSNDPVERASAAISQMNELRNLITDIENVRDKFKSASLECMYCKRQDEHLDRCEYKAYCEGVLRMGEHLAKRQELNINLSLQKRLAQVVNSLQNEPHRVQSKTGKYDYILQMISDLIKEKQKFKAINEEMHVILQGSLTKAHFVSAFVTSKQTEMDVQVSCHLNYYPIRLKVKNSKLRGVVDRVVGILPKGGWVPSKFQEYVGEYLKLDAEWDDNEESELVRSFLYLIMKETKRSRSIAEKFLVLEKRLDDETRQEFRYLQCFALWQEENFEKAIQSANAGIAYNKKDGRFFQCRSLLLYNSLIKSKDFTHDKWEEVTKDAQKAVELFLNKQDVDMVAVNYNNLAFFRSCYAFNIVNIDLAEKYLEELKKRIPEQDWTPRYPEFYHTKGGVLYASFLVTKNEETLKEAYKAAMEAFKLYPSKSEHVDLKNEIEKSFRELHISLPKVL
jgi:hypothetical protein